jgi:hypothetical protein
MPLATDRPVGTATGPATLAMRAAYTPGGYRADNRSPQPEQSLRLALAVTELSFVVPRYNHWLYWSTGAGKTTTMRLILGLDMPSRTVVMPAASGCRWHLVSAG